MVVGQKSISGHVQPCPTVQPEPFPDVVNLLAIEQVGHGAPKTSAYCVVTDLIFRLFGPGAGIELVPPLVATCSYNTVRKARGAIWGRLAMFLNGELQRVESLAV